VVFFPSARVNFLKDSTQLGDITFIDYVIKSGRAVIYPIYERMYERRSSLPVLPGPTLARQLMVDWSKDLARSIDYLQTRADIDRSRIGYLGVSAGSAYGVILTTLEDRLKAVVFLDGGFFQQEHPVAGMDQADFAPRMKKPVLMVNGPRSRTKARSCRCFACWARPRRTNIKSYSTPRTTSDCRDPISSGKCSPGTTDISDT